MTSIRQPGHSSNESHFHARGKQTVALALGATLIGLIVGVALGTHVSVNAGIAAFGSIWGVGVVTAMVLSIRAELDEKKQRENELSRVP
jgi:hypothetical protein